ncbi:DNA topoisomerase 2-beta [Phytophthora pseudosyringae]|uniref:DNA topoisomerase (ATP-hydrolyzing) n=1 Tax=Phytophthora pseudosyringae TaxID=221518 RepID=A0A8T1VA27_9STRA|nr:DNA topoisomerase 2-beta [Phytophthora pseudosyringae]
MTVTALAKKWEVMRCLFRRDNLTKAPTTDKRVVFSRAAKECQIDRKAVAKMYYEWTTVAGDASRPPFTPLVRHKDLPSVAEEREEYALQQVLSFVGDAEVAIFVMVYSFTLEALADALVAARARGVNVKVYLDNAQSYKKASEKSIKILVDGGVEDGTACFSAAALNQEGISFATGYEYCEHYLKIMWRNMVKSLPCDIKPTPGSAGATFLAPLPECWQKQHTTPTLRPVDAAGRMLMVAESGSSTGNIALLSAPTTLAETMAVDSDTEDNQVERKREQKRERNKMYASNRRREKASKFAALEYRVERLRAEVCDLESKKATLVRNSQHAAMASTATTFSGPPPVTTAVTDYTKAKWGKKRLSIMSKSARTIADRKNKFETVVQYLLRCVRLPGSAMKCLHVRQNLSTSLFEFLGVQYDADKRSLFHVFVDNCQESQSVVMMTPSKTKKKAPAPRKKKTTGAAGKATAGAKKTTTKKAKTPSKKKTKADAWDSDASDESEGSVYDVDDSGDEALAAANAEEGKGTPKQSIEQIYQKKTQLEHILLRPDTYVGSIEHVEQSMWVFDDEKKRMVMKKINYVPGLYKIFDEIIVNACDNKQRDKSMNALKVTIDVEKNEISVWNNGKGIPIVLHKDHKVYVPELIFGHLLTGSNFDDKKKKTTGGRNGYGAKLANIFSNEFVVETADSSTKQRYKQVFENNMGKKNPPSITKWAQKDYTCISFKPDLERFKMDFLNDDIVSLFKKRVYDVAGVSGKGLNVFLNDEKIPIKSFPQYVALYPGPRGFEAEKDAKDDEDSHPEENNGDDEDYSEEKSKKAKVKAKPSNVTKNGVIFEKPDERWQVGVGLSEDGFQQVSFVNGICTTKGGQHVAYIVDQITTKLVSVLKKKNKGEAVKPNYIKNHMSIYVSALINNPAFDSQTKETLTTRPNGFGSTFSLSDKFLKQVEKSGLVEKILSFAAFKQTAELRRKGGSSGKRSRLTGIPKLDDANNAGTAKSKDCTLILTEGDSAKTVAVGGLAVVGRDYYGVFPLRGKMLNVREASHTQILKNEEIQNVVKILGLKYGQKYESTKGLRYGHLMIMADQDHDGSHIKGLVINLIHHFWPSLLLVDGFLQEFITPIVKCTKGRTKEVFYTMPEYEAWRERTNQGRGWVIKYYKGLGTSTAAETKEYFSDLQTHQIGFTYEGDGDADVIDMAFSKKRVEDRKDWLRGYEPGTYVDYDVDEMGYTDFVNKELILFSMADNIRSIPSVVDGFKPSQRKVLFCCFKRNLRAELKVAQLAGYVSEHSAYHHGEQSLQGCIVNMAQDFVGSNNVHLLSPIGQFGTRLMGGKDAASARYIFTNLELLTRRIYDPLDNDCLKYLDEDGQSIEPAWYIPIIPMVLVNGSDGIGTGWSSSVPNYNPLDIIKGLRQMINGEQAGPLTPWYRGFTGHMVEKTNSRGTDTSNYIVQGLYEVTDESTLVISELPVKTWTQSYKQFLESLLDAGTIKDFKENHTDVKVLFTITMEPKALTDTAKAPGGIVKKFKLESSLSTSNMHLFDAAGHIKKYDNPKQIMEEFYGIRLEFYDRRKKAMLQKLQDQIKLLSNKARFVLSVVEGKLVVNNRKKQELLEELIAEGYDQIAPKLKKKTDSDDSNESDDEETNVAGASRGYDYLLSMKIWSLTKERVDKLRAELQEREQEYTILEGRTVQDLWLTDLDALEKMLVETETERERILAHTPKKKNGKGRKPAAKKRKRKNKNASDDDDDDDDSDFEVAGKKKPRKTPVKSKPPVKRPIKKEPAASKTNGTKENKTNGVKPGSITSFFKPKEEPPAAKEESEEEVEELSLAERLARRFKVSPQKVAAASTSTPKAKRTTKPAAAIDLASSDDEKTDVKDEEDDVFAMESDDASKKAAPTKPKAPARKAAPKKATAPKKAASGKKTTPAKRKPKNSPLEDNSEDETEASEAEASDDGADPSPMAPRPQRGVRTQKRIIYDEISSDEEEDEDKNDEEEESFALEDDADDSDFE